LGVGRAARRLRHRGAFRACPEVTLTSANVGGELNRGGVMKGYEKVFVSLLFPFGFVLMVLIVGALAIGAYRRLPTVPYHPMGPA